MFEGDKRLKEQVQQNLDKELHSIKFSHKSKSIVVHRVKSRQSLLRRFLDYEIEIPMKPAVALVVLCSIGIGYLSYPALKVNEKDISENRIEIVQITARR